MALNGIDISNNNGAMDLSGIPFDFVICKATEGTTFVDSYCDGFIQQAYKLGKLTGVYHFARTGNAKEQARYFVAAIEGYVGKTALFLDWENAGTYDTSVLSQGPGWAKEWLDEVYRLTGVRPMVYMSKSVCREYDWSAVAKEYSLWMAQYPNYEPTGYQAEPWTDGGGAGAWGNGWAIHQYASTGRLQGYDGNLDINIFYGTAEQWNKYAGTQSGASNPSSGGSESKLKSVAKVAKEVLNGKWGNGGERKRRLTEAGYDYDKVQAKVNELVGGSNTKSVDTLAVEVINGKWGDGNQRRNALTNAGYNYDDVQGRVNAYVDTADQVIQGLWGNGDDRRNKLQAAGYNYDAVQKLVNAKLGG